jgi:putative endonuclease
MGFVYILESEISARFHVGSTDEIPRRFAEHQRGKDKATRNRGPWILVYSEQFATLAEARRREFEIKQWKSWKMIRAFTSYKPNQNLAPAARHFNA